MTSTISIHPGSFLFGQALVSLLFGWITFALSRSYPPAVCGFRHYSMALVLLAAAHVLLALQGAESLAWMQWAAGVAQAGAAAIVARGMGQMNAKRVRLDLLVALVAALAGASAVSVAQDGVAALDVVSHAIGLVLTAAALWATLRRPLASNSASTWLVVAGIGALAAHAAVRAGLAGSQAMDFAFGHPLAAAASATFAGVATAAASLGVLLLGNERMREEMERIAVREPNSGLYTQAAFLEVSARRAIASFNPTLTRRRADAAPGVERERYGMLLLRVDNFESIAAEHGEPGTRALARAFGALLAKAIRSTDFAGRLRHDTFAVYVSDASDAGVASLATRLVQAARLSSPATTVCPSFTVSLGGAMALPGESLDACMERAAHALDVAQAGGGNRFEVAA